MFHLVETYIRVQKGKKYGKEISNSTLWKFVFECLLSCSALCRVCKNVSVLKLSSYSVAMPVDIKQFKVACSLLALQSVLLPTVLCGCLVTLLVAASCLSHHIIHVERNLTQNCQFVKCINGRKFCEKGKI